MGYFNLLKMNYLNFYADNKLSTFFGMYKERKFILDGDFFFVRSNSETFYVDESGVYSGLSKVDELRVAGVEEFFFTEPIEYSFIYPVVQNKLVLGLEFIKKSDLIPEVNIILLSTEK